MTGALFLSGGKLLVGGAGLVTIPTGGSSPLAMVGGHASSGDPQGAIVAAFTLPDGTNPTGLDITSFDDGAGGANFKLDEWNNVLVASPTGLPIGTGTITMSGTLPGSGAFTNLQFTMQTHDNATLVPKGTIVFTPATGGPAVWMSQSIAINPRFWLDCAGGVPPPGTPLGTFSVVGDPAFTAPAWTHSQIFGGGVSTTGFAVNASTGVLTTTSFFTAVAGAQNIQASATQGGVTYSGTAIIHTVSTAAPMLAYTVTSASWAAGVLTVNIPSGDQLWYPNSTQVALTGFVPSAINGSYTTGAGTAEGILKLPLASNPGAITTLGQLESQYVIATYITSTLAATDGSCIVATVGWAGNGTFGESLLANLCDDQGGLFRITGTETPPHNISVCAPLSAGTYNIGFRGYINLSGQFNPATNTIPITVLDATPTVGASIVLATPTGIKNNTNLGTTIIPAPTITGLTGTKQFALHQSDARMRFQISQADGSVTTVAPIRIGKYTLTIVVTDGTNTANATVQFTCTEFIGPTVTIGPGLANSTPYASHQTGTATYPTQTAFLTDMFNESGRATNIACPLSGAQVTLLQNTGGAIWAETPTLFYSPWRLMGDPTSPTKILVGMTPGMSNSAFYQPTDVDFFIDNICIEGVHQSPGRGIFVGGYGNGSGGGRLVATNVEIRDCDHGIQGGGPGGVWITNRVYIHGCGDTGQEHDIYALGLHYIESTDSLFTQSINGANIWKTRAVYGKFINSAAYDGNLGTGSSALEMCNGGNYLVANSTLQYGPNDQLWNGIQFHAEKQISTALIDTARGYGNTYICDDQDSVGQVTYQWAISSNAYGTPMLFIDVNPIFYGANSNTGDIASAAFKTPIGLLINPSYPSVRPAFELIDPSTGSPPTSTLVATPPYRTQQGPHESFGTAVAGGNVSPSPQAIIGSNSTNGQIITVSAAASPNGTVVETFQLVTAPWSYNIGTTTLITSAPTWAMADGAKLALPGISSGAGSPLSATGNTTGLSLDPVSGALTVTGYPLAQGARFISVAATQTGADGKCNNFTILVTP